MLEDTNLNVKIASKEESIWLKVKEESEAQIKSFENSLIINKAILELAIRKIEESKL